MTLIRLGNVLSHEVLSLRKVLWSIFLQLVFICGHLIFFQKNYFESFYSNIPGNVSLIVQVGLGALPYIAFLIFQDIEISKNQSLVLIRTKNYQQWLNAFLLVTLFISLSYWAIYLSVAVFLKGSAPNLNHHLAGAFIFYVLSTIMISSVAQVLLKITHNRLTSLAILGFGILVNTSLLENSSSEWTNLLTPFQMILPVYASKLQIGELSALLIVKIIGCQLLLRKLFSTKGDLTYEE